MSISTITHAMRFLPSRGRFVRGLLTVTLCVLCLVAGLVAGPRLVSLYDYLFPAPAFTTGNFGNLYRDEGKPVVVFTTSTCPFCRATRELLTREHIDFKELVTDQSPEAREKFIALGGDAVPMLFVGHRRIVGYREDVIRQSLANPARD